MATSDPEKLTVRKLHERWPDVLEVTGVVEMAPVAGPKGHSGASGLFVSLRRPGDSPDLDLVADHLTFLNVAREIVRTLDPAPADQILASLKRIESLLEK